MNNINIITSFFLSHIIDPNIQNRNNELIKIIYIHIHSPHVDKIYLYIDDDISYNKLKELFQSRLDDGKIIIIEIGKQPLYSDLFKYANESLQGKICMITNSDIYIHECDNRLINMLPTTPNLLFALTRHEHDMSCPLINNYMGSHDCFIFNSPLNGDFIKNIEFTQNNWRSENKLLRELVKENIKILNPCNQIQIVHLHNSDIREKDRIWIIDDYSNEDPNCHSIPCVL